LVNVCFCCVRFSFFHTKSRDWLGERLQNDLVCVEWNGKPQLSQSVSRRARNKLLFRTLMPLNLQRPSLAEHC